MKYFAYCNLKMVKAAVVNTLVTAQNMSLQVLLLCNDGATPAVGPHTHLVTNC